MALAFLKEWPASCLSVPDARTASDASIAASLPNPIAIPQSLAERTGASLMPSPTKQAPLDFDFKPLKSSSF